MRAVSMPDARTVEVCDWPDPRPEGDEVVVRVEAAAICGSDLHGLYRRPGPKAWVPGHEGAGVVAAVDRPRRVKVGDRVIMLAFRTCGECDLCRAGYVSYCPAKKGVYGFGLNGFQAEYVRVAESCLLPLPQAVPFEVGCLILDPIGAPYHAHRRMGTNATHTVGVFGLGPMGLGAVLLAARLGTRTIAIDPIAYRRDLARRLGAAETADPGAGGVVEEVRRLARGRGLDRALECSGSPEALAAALDLVRPLGHVAVIGENREARINPSAHFAHKEITLSGSCCFPLGEYGDILALLESGLPAADLVTHRFPLAEAAAAYRAFDQGATGKVVLLPQA
jgi:threonine dehydrogenase-like Zn-dependent dehydrogenase